MQYYEEGEKNTKFFLNQVKQNGQKGTIRQLKVTSSNGEETSLTDPDIILQHIHDFSPPIVTRDSPVFNFAQ